jgi:hypothetical protein
VAGLREDVVTVLQAIASKDEQYQWYRTTEGKGNLARGLWTFWMRDAYLPHKPEFLTSFTETELQQLERFTQFFEARLSLFPARFESLMVDMYWVSVMEYAEALLEDLAEYEGADGDD